MGYGKHVVWIWKWMMCATSGELWQNNKFQKQIDLNRHGFRIVQELYNLAGVPEDKLPKKWNCSRKFEGSTIDSTAAVLFRPQEQLQGHVGSKTSGANLLRPPWECQYRHETAWHGPQTRHNLHLYRSKCQWGCVNSQINATSSAPSVSCAKGDPRKHREAQPREGLIGLLRPSSVSGCSWREGHTCQTSTGWLG